MQAHTPQAQLEALLAEEREVHALRDLRLLTGLSLGEARAALRQVSGGAGWPLEVAQALPSWGDTAAQRALREELWSLLAERGRPRALLFAERDFRDGVLALVDEELVFARRGLRGPELDALGTLAEIKRLEASEGLSGVELRLSTGGKEDRLRRVSADALPLIARLQEKIDASGAGAPEAVVEPIAPRPARSDAAPLPKPAPQARPELPNKAPLFEDPPEVATPVPSPTSPATASPALRSADPPGLRQPLRASLSRLGVLCGVAVALSTALWQLPLGELTFSKTPISWSLDALVGVALLRAPKRLPWALGGAALVSLLSAALIQMEQWSGLAMTWPLLGAFWLRAQGREGWVREVLLMGAAVFLVAQSVDRIWMMLGGPPAAYGFLKLYAFWAMHLLWERRRAA